MTSPLEALTLLAVADEAEAIVRRLFPDKRREPPGLKLELVRVIRKAETRGVQACMQHFAIDVDGPPESPDAA